MKLILVIISTLLLIVVALSTVFAGNSNTCPDGAGWTKVDSDDLSTYPVNGATQYCFKAGSENSQGCEGGLFRQWPQPDGTCGLSHWSHFIPEASPTPVESPEPTKPPCREECEPTPTVEPTPEPTPLVCEGDQHIDASGKKCVSFQYGGVPDPLYEEIRAAEGPIFGPAK